MTKLDEILALLGERTGMRFPAHRRPALEAIVEARRVEAGCRTLDELVGRLRGEPALLDELAEEVTIGETYFFREPWAFRSLRRHLASAGRDATRPLRLWSAGCSSGEEAYSLAMTAVDAGRGDALSVIATDLSAASLARARAARYGEWSLRGDGRRDALPHLERSGDGWRVREPIRARVRFERFNLAIDALPSFALGLYGLDAIFCRNVLVYFDRTTIARVVRGLHACLAEGGLLFLAATDPSIDERLPFERVGTDEGVSYRKTTAATLLSPKAESSATPPPTAREAPPLLSPPSYAPPDRARGAPHRAGRARAKGSDEAILADASSAATHLRAVAERDPARAVELAATLARRHPLSVEIHYVGAILWLDAGRLDEAAEAARRVLYLDRTLAAAHLALATILERRGDREGARRAYRNARDLCRSRPGDETIALTDGEPAKHLAEVADAQLAALGAG